MRNNAAIFCKRRMSVYYVSSSTGDDGNDGLTQQTAWATIAKVNGLTLTPKDNILFKKGDVWKEQLVIPSSGTTGGLIKFGSYGDSTQNGKTIATWTDYSSSGNVGDTTVGVANNTRLGNYIYYFKVTTTNAGSVPSVSIYVGASGSGNAKAAIYSNNNKPNAVLATSEQITLSTNGWNTFTFTSPISVTANTIYYVAIATASNYSATTQGSGGVYTTGHVARTYDGSFTDNPSWSQSALTDFDVYMTVSANQNIWRANENATVSKLYFDATEGVKKTSIAVLTTDLNFCQIGSDVYCYSTSDPDTRFTDVTADITYIKPIIDGNGAQYTITAGTGVSYVEIDGIDITDTGTIHAAHASVTIPTDSTHWTIKNCNIHGVASKKTRWGVYAVVDSGGYHTVKNNNFYDMTSRAVYFYTPSNTADPGHLKWGINVTGNTFKRIYGGGVGAEQTVVGTYSAGSNISNNYFYDCCRTNGDNHVMYLYHLNGEVNNPVNIINNIVDQCGGDDIQLQVYHTSQYVNIAYNVICNSSKGIGVGIVDSGVVDYVNIYNNTLYNLTAAAASGITLDYTGHCNVKNNLMVEVMGSLAPDRRTRYNIYVSNNAVGPIVFDKNILYAANPFMSGANPTYAYYNATDYNNTTWNTLNNGVITVIDDSFNVNPLLVSSTDFNLQAASPAINAGVYVGLTTDILGNAIIGLPDLGAYEYGY